MSGAAPLEPQSASVVTALAALKADADALRAALKPGDIVPAKVLPFDGVSDLIEVLGRRVAAELPPSFRPGDSLSLEVVGFEGDRLIARAISREPGDETVRVQPPPSEAPASSANPPALPARAPAAAPSTMTPLEARIAAARTAPPSAPLAPPSARRTAPPPARAPQNIPPPPRGAPASATTSPYASALAARYVRATPEIARAATPPPIAVTTAAARTNAPTGPAALLRALNVPETPLTLAAASLVLRGAVRVPAVLTHLDDALAHAGEDETLSENAMEASHSLRALAGFISRIDAESPELATQLATYADHVLRGREAKLTNVLAEPSVPEGEPAQLTHDLKTLLLQTLGPQDEATAHTPVQNALRDAVTTVTAAQLETLSAAQDAPQAFSFAIPLQAAGQQHTVTLQVRRDPPQGAKKLDGDNFHVAFILDTAHLGTVAIDLEGVGRKVRMLVRTERENAAKTVQAGLGDLKAQFERMRYEVAGMSAAMLPHGERSAAVVPALEPEPPPPAEVGSFDRRA